MDGRRHFLRSRRQFLKQSAASLGTLALAAGTGRTAWEAQANMLERKHLITIQGGGGWDPFWGHSTWPAAWAQFTDSELYSHQYDERGNIVRTHHNLYTRRFGDGGFMLHPRRPDIQLGLGMKLPFQSMPSLFDEMLIWQGIQKDSDHGIGNKLIMQGSLSQYALSLSTLVAMKLAEQRLRPLHFVQISDTPAGLNTNWAFAKGAGVPTNIGSYDAFRALTRPSVSDFAETSRRQVINDAVARLTSAIGMPALQLSSSKGIYRTFLDAFNGALAIGGSQVAESIEFLYVWKSYVVYAMSIYNELHGSGILGLMTPGVLGHEFIDITRHGAASHVNSASNYQLPDGRRMAELPTPAEIAGSQSLGSDAKLALKRRVDDFLDIRAHVGGFYGAIVDYAFSYAMADFLVKSDLSAVVDIGTPAGDYHDNADEQLLRQILTYAYLRKLIENLKSYPFGGTGNSLLDITTVVVNSELDRPPAFSVNVQERYRGTSHGPYTSMILAGYGVNKGKVIGGVKSGPGGPYMEMSGGLVVRNLFPAFGYNSALPVNPVTGLPDENGQWLNTKSLLPTICSIFEIPVPANQITDSYEIPCLMRKS